MANGGGIVDSSVIQLLDIHIRDAHNHQSLEISLDGSRALEGPSPICAQLVAWREI